jgi:hypothetical protein
VLTTCGQFPVANPNNQGTTMVFMCLPPS